MNTKIALLALLSPLVVSQSQAAYIPDNNGRSVYINDGSRRAADFGASHYNQRVRATRSQERVSRRHTRTHHRRQHHRETVDANANTATGLVISAKTGATAHVAPAYAARFQDYINDLESTGAKIIFMGGYRRGRCSPGHQHPCGKALDVCQLSRGRVAPECNLPGRVVMAALAMKNGLFEGALWCDGDYGHAQVSVSAEACRKNLYAAVTRFKDVVLAKKEDDVDPEAKVYDYSLVAALNVEEPESRLSARRHHHRHVRYARHHHRHRYAHRRHYYYYQYASYQ